MKTIESVLGNTTFYALILATCTSWINLFFLKSKIWSNISKSSTFFSSLFVVGLLVSRWTNGKYFPFPCSADTMNTSPYWSIDKWEIFPIPMHCRHS